MFDVREKVAIVTGAAGGIGLEIAKAFASEGVKLVAVDISEDLKDIIKDNVKEYSFEPLIIKADLTNNTEVEKIIADTVANFGTIDILVNSAGVNVRKKLDEYTQEDLDYIIDLNVKAIFNISNKAAAVMKERSYGKIINFSSTQGITCWNGNGRFSLAPYCASKAALIAMTKAFALDLAKHNITVNAICPAFVDTPLVRPVKDDAELYEDIISRTPLGRFAAASELIGPTMFLSSDASSFVTGHALLVDGGWTIE
ncbi:MAG: SDR family oxidoreductase [Waddliaceae bacterium]|jgi:gluconate 5-dehydrogenase|nr:SDR family oxidoreductase [Waddliaceae bacterium]MBT3579003.1 SDR family oxidoreductase [Waddliaceae bacterium]MBT6928593.1 SDR family oxidoreductase [Waddliaceae bacterium]MBT7264254.1 SDR family oxidoreductase [Waddliaceae bacterium]MBT7461105.1 SDR family oxidoreductase [Waddliaceae bacterium]